MKNLSELSYLELDAMFKGLDGLQRLAANDEEKELRQAQKVRIANEMGKRLDSV